jgi:hypothetical protein
VNLDGLRTSNWQFNTSNGLGVGAAVVGAEAGSITLDAPTTRQPTKFLYAAGGAGLSWGIKLPKVGKVQLKVKGKSVGGTASSETLPSYGIVYMVPMFAGSELRPSDINGACAFVELNAGVVAGAAGYAMLFGMSPAWFAAALIGGATAGGHFWHQALQTAAGVLLFAGANVGPQFGYGGMAFGGYLREDPF